MIKNVKRAVSVLLITLLLFTQIPSAFAQTTEYFIISDETVNPCLLTVPDDSAQLLSDTENIPESKKYIKSNSEAAEFIRTQLKNREPKFLLQVEIPRKIEMTTNQQKEVVKQMIWDYFELAIGETDREDEGDYLRYSYKSKAFSASCQYGEDKTQFFITYEMQYFTTLEQEQELTLKLKQIIDGFGFTAETTEYKKIKTIYDYIIDHIKYDEEHVKDETCITKFSAYGALIKKRAVCQGYAQLFYRMVKDVGIDSRVITGYGGKVTSDTELPENHAWNIVRVGDLYYYADSTWDVGHDLCDYFLKGENDFPDHVKTMYYETADFKKAYPISKTAISCVYGDEWHEIDAEHHAKLCKNCELPGELYWHKLNESSVCEDCGFVGEGHQHVYDNACDTACNLCSTKRKISHSYGSYVYNNDATAKKDGTKTRTCKICGATDTVVAAGTKLKNPFGDVKASDYYYEPVLWAVKNSVTSGLSKTEFGPSDYCTRGQVVTFLWRAAGCPTVKNNKNPFVDVKSSQFYYKAVLWAVEQGITSGTSNTTFEPNATCSRGQIVAFLYRFAGSPKVSTSNPFTDVSSKQYFYKPVLWAVKNGITSGVDKTSFAPDETCTRAQVVSFLYRYMSK